MELIAYHLIAMLIAFLLDFVIGDPPKMPHPVRVIGSLIQALEGILNQGNHKRVRGFLCVVLVDSLVFGVTFIIVFFAYHMDPLLGLFVEGIFIFTTISMRNLKEAALDVYHPLANGNITLAQQKLSWIVGRDTEHLDESETTRGVIETVSENTSDGITAPLFYAFIGGAPLAMLYRAVNTCDSMLGYKNDRFIDFGYAAAKIDDLFNLIPSRITGWLSICVNPSFLKESKRECFRMWLRDAKKHPSPNSGYLEAATASLLGIQLGGLNYYQGEPSYRETMGDKKREMNKEDMIRAIQIMNRTSLAFFIFLWVIGGMIYGLTCAWG